MKSKKLLALVTSAALLVTTFLPAFADVSAEKAFPQSGNWVSPSTTPRILQWGGPVNTMPYWYTEALKKKDMDNAVVEYFNKWRSDFFKYSYAKNGGTAGEYGVIEGHITGGTAENTGMWKNTELISASEHTGYGMVIFALMAGYEGDNGQCKADFDALVKTYRQLERPNHLMSWGVPKSYDVFKTAQDEANKADLPTSATDGDFDIAYALILAEKQWPNGSIHGESYLKMAQDMIDNGIAKDLIHPTTKRILLGDWHSKGINEGWAPKLMFNPYVTRSSDFMFENLRAFKDYTRVKENKALFNDAIDECYRILDVFSKEHNNGTGLLPDFMINAYVEDGTMPDWKQDEKGNWIEIQVPNYKFSDKIIPAPQLVYDVLSEPFPSGAYSENSCRLPQRLALDFIHSNDQRAKTFTDMLGDFISTKNSGVWGPVWDKVRDGYMLNGDLINWPTNPSLGKYSGVEALQFVSCFVSSCMVDNGLSLGAGFSFLANTHTSDLGVGDPYFKDTLTLMNLLMISGNWWYPSVNDAPVVVPNIPTWTLNTTYSQGQKVLYNGKQYDCVYTHTAYAETWAPGAPGIWFWQEVK